MPTVLDNTVIDNFARELFAFRTGYSDHARSEWNDTTDNLVNREGYREAARRVLAMSGIADLLAETDALKAENAKLKTRGEPPVMTTTDQKPTAAEQRARDRDTNIGAIGALLRYDMGPGAAQVWSLDGHIFTSKRGDVRLEIGEDCSFTIRFRDLNGKDSHASLPAGTTYGVVNEVARLLDTLDRS